MNFQLKPFQWDFVYSKARHPGFVGGWNTGKTLCAISRSRIYSKGIPENLGIIFRKTARSLTDSTLKDFERYTGLKVNSNRNHVDKNGSVTMFRHIDEIGSINQQNINLGWFYIEQGEELENNEAFFMLFGRLRRQLKPSEQFLKLKLPVRSGWVIANAGDHWMRPLWKDRKLDDSAKLINYEGLFSELIEATTWDNEIHAAPDFLASLRVLEREQPELYKQYVLNDWDVAVTNRIFTYQLLELMRSKHTFLKGHGAMKGVSVDPSGEGADDNVFMAGDGGDPIEIFRKTTMSPTEKAYKAVEMCHRINGSFIIVDCDGIGIETYSELSSFDQSFMRGIQVMKFHGSEPSEMLLGGRMMYANKRAEAAFISQKRGWDGKASINRLDTRLVEELEADEYFTNNRGLVQVIPKKDIKEKIKRSPGLADCWKMLQWAFEQEHKDTTYEDTTHRLPDYALHDDETESRRGSFNSLPAWTVHE